jgi:hypothetical protein
VSTEHTPLEINYYLYFPTEEAAQRAGQRLVGDGYRVEVRDVSEVDTSNPWLTYVTSTLPESDDDLGLGEVEEYMEAIAASEGGEYDGYERDVRH